jgi:hypothetical protein
MQAQYNSAVGVFRLGSARLKLYLTIFVTSRRLAGISFQGLSSRTGGSLAARATPEGEA